MHLHDFGFVSEQSVSIWQLLLPELHSRKAQDADLRGFLKIYIFALF